MDHISVGDLLLVEIALEAESFLDVLEVRTIYIRNVYNATEIHYITSNISNASVVSSSLLYSTAH